MDKFDQRDVYANHVRIYYQIGGICEVSLDISKLCEITPPLKIESFRENEKEHPTLAAESYYFKRG